MEKKTEHGLKISFNTISMEFGNWTSLSGVPQNPKLQPLYWEPYSSESLERFHSFD